MNLILIEPDEIDGCSEVTLAGGRADHIRRVLEAGGGREVRIGLVDGPRGIGTLMGAPGQSVQLRCAFEDAVPPVPDVDLLLALPRPKVMRRLWAQLSALGVGRILLTNAARVERNYFDTHVLSAGCYRPLLIEGLQQVRDTRLPEVTVHRQLKVLVEDHLDALAGKGTRLVAHPAATPSVNEILSTKGAGRVLLAVGPEGGWSDFETSLLEGHGFQPAGMGPRTLRTDTACIALLGLVHDALNRRNP